MEDDLGFDFDVDDEEIEKKLNNRFYKDLTKLTDSHLTNRLKYFERILADNPGEQYYMGTSDAAEDAVECENRHNEILAEEITEHIKELKEELKKRGEKMNLRERPYLEVEVVEVKKKEYIPKPCRGCSSLVGCTLIEERRRGELKLRKGTWVNGENLDKIEFSFLCSFGVDSQRHGMVIKTLMDYADCDDAYLLFSIDGQSKGLTSIDRECSLEHLIETHNIKVLKGKIILFKEIK